MRAKGSVGPPVAFRERLGAGSLVGRVQQGGVPTRRSLGRVGAAAGGIGKHVAPEVGVVFLVAVGVGLDDVAHVPDADVAGGSPDVRRMDFGKRRAGGGLVEGEKTGVRPGERRKRHPDEGRAGWVPRFDLVIEVVADGVGEAERRVGAVGRRADVCVAEARDALREPDERREVLERRGPVVSGGRKRDFLGEDRRIKRGAIDGGGKRKGGEERRKEDSGRRISFHRRGWCSGVEHAKHEPTFQNAGTGYNA